MAEPNTKFDQPGEFLSIDQVAKRYGIGQSTIYRNIKLGRFPAPQKICGANRWHVSDLPGPSDTEAA